jgi:hypothetical protein
MKKVYFVVKKVGDEWQICLINVGVLHNSLSDLTDKRRLHYSLHVANEREAQNYIDKMKNEGDTAEYKTVEGKFRFDYDFSNVTMLNSEQ